MFGNNNSAQDIANVIRQGQREGFIAGAAVAAGTYVFARLATPTVRDYWNEKVTHRNPKKV